MFIFVHLVIQIKCKTLCARIILWYVSQISFCLYSWPTICLRRLYSLHVVLSVLRPLLHVTHRKLFDIWHIWSLHKSLDRMPCFIWINRHCSFVPWLSEFLLTELCQTGFPSTDSRQSHRVHPIHEAKKPYPPAGHRWLKEAECTVGAAG